MFFSTVKTTLSNSCTNVPLEHNLNYHPDLDPGSAEPFAASSKLISPFKILFLILLALLNNFLLILQKALFLLIYDVL